MIILPDPLLALTLRHPWPWAICELGKRLENRRWAPPPTMLRRGDWFAIHGGAPPRGEYADYVCDEGMRLLTRFGTLEYRRRFRPDHLVRTGVVAVCRFGGIVKSSDDPWFEGPLAWQLDDVIVLREPVPCSGRQKLWAVVAGVRLAAQRQVNSIAA